MDISRRHAWQTKILEPGKRKRTAAEVSLRQTLYLDARCFARVEKICWSACIDGLTSIQRNIQLKLLKEKQSQIFSETANYSTVARVMHFQVLFIAVLV